MKPKVALKLIIIAASIALFGDVYYIIGSKILNDSNIFIQIIVGGITFNLLAGFILKIIPGKHVDRYMEWNRKAAHRWLNIK